MASVLDALTASGEADRTVVVFTSDHGEMAGSHGLRQKGNLIYDENFHVPLIVCHPDHAGGQTTEAWPRRSIWCPPSWTSPESTRPPRVAMTGSSGTR